MGTATIMNPDWREAGREELELLLYALKALDSNIIKRNEIEHQLQHQVKKRQEILALVLALICTLAVFLLFFSTLLHEFAQQNIKSISWHFITLAAVFVLAYALLSKLPHSFVRRSSGKQLKKQAEQEIRRLNQDNQTLFQSKTLLNPILPAQFFSIQAIIILLRYFEYQQATFLDGALDLLTMDLERSQIGGEDLSQYQHYQDEKLYLENYWKNHEKLTERGEG